MTLRFVLAAVVLWAMVWVHQAAAVEPASPATPSGSFARVDVQTPDALIPGKILNARVAITMTGVTTALAVEAKAKGAGLTLPLKRRWQFVKVAAGKTVEFQMPYQTTKHFQAGEIVLSISAIQGKQKLPVQSATLSLSK